MNVFELFASLSLKADSFFTGLASAGQALSSFGGEIENVFRVIRTIDNIITKPFDTVVSVIADGLSELAEKGTEFVQSFVQEGMSFDTAMSQVGATLLQTRDDMDATTVSVDGFNGTLREFAKKLGAETMFTATQSAEALNYMALAGYDAQTSAEMLPKVLNLAAAGAMDLGTASDMVTDSQTALGIKMEEMTTFIDQMAKTASSSNTSVAQLGDAILSIGATGRQVKGGFTELNTVLGVLADNGIKASESGNMLRRLLTNLTTAEGEAKEQLDKLGVSVFDTQGNMRDLPSIFLELDKAMSGLTDQERAKAISDIFGQYSLAGANALLKTSAERWEELTGKIKDSEGAAQAMADIQLDTLPGQITILQSAFSGLQTELYEKVAPATKEFVEKLSSGLSDVTAEITEGDWGEAFSKLGEIAVELINEGVDTILNNEDTVTEFVDGFLTFIEKVANNLLDSGSVVLPELLDFVLDIGDKVITGMVDFLSDEENLEKIRGTINLLLIKLQAFLDEHEDDLYTIFDTIYDVGIGFVKQIFAIKRKTTSDILWRKIQEIFQPVGDAIWHWIDKWIVHFGDTWESLFQPIGNALGRWLVKQKNKVKQEFKDIKTFFSGWWDTIVKFWSDKLLAIKAWFDESKELITTAFENFSLADIGKNLIKGLWQGMNDTFLGWLRNKIGGLADNVVGYFEDFFDINSPSKVMEKRVGVFLAEGIGVGFTKEMDKVTEDMQKALPTSFDVNTDIVSKSVPTQSNFGGNTFELHIENFYNNTPDDIHKIGKLIYDDVFRQKVAMI